MDENEQGNIVITIRLADADGHDQLGEATLDDAAFTEAIEKAVFDGLKDYHDEILVEEAAAAASEAAAKAESEVSDFVVVNTASVLIVALLAMIAGGVLIRTLLRSFEKVGYGD